MTKHPYRGWNQQQEENNQINQPAGVGPHLVSIFRLFLRFPPKRLIVNGINHFLLQFSPPHKDNTQAAFYKAGRRKSPDNSGWSGWWIQFQIRQILTFSFSGFILFATSLPFPAGTLPPTSGFRRGLFLL